MQLAYTEILGSVDLVRRATPFPVFDSRVVSFLNDVSRLLLSDARSKEYKDLMAIGFFIRKSSILQLKEKYYDVNRVGVGLAFHITPSNIPVQFFHSLVVSLLSGNANIVRLSNKVFPQTTILCECIQKALIDNNAIVNRICLVQYGHEKTVTDWFSDVCDVRIIWGGDGTIKKVRESELQARTYDVPFADRFSFALIDAEKYNGITDEEKAALAMGFYYDTYFSDQNACNSPRMVVWYGCKESSLKAQREFWKHLSVVVTEQYELSVISGVDKLVAECEIFMNYDALINEDCSFCNYINVVDVDAINQYLSDFKGNSGLFMQVVTDDLRSVLKNVRKDWQTLAYFGFDSSQLLSLIFELGVKGIDRIVPIGRAGNPSLEWDGVSFIERLSRRIMTE